MPKRAPAQRLTAIKVATSLWTLLVNRTQASCCIQRYARTVTTLIHAAHPRVLRQELIRHHISFP